MFKRRTARTAAVILTVITSAIWADGAELPAPIVPDPDVQSLIDRIMRAPRRDAAYYAHVIALREIAHPRHPNFREAERAVVLQAAYYAAHGEKPPPPKDGDADTGEGFDSTYALHRVKAEVEIPGTVVIHTVLPYLRSDDDRLREFIKEHVLDGDSPTHELERTDELVSALAMYIGERRKDPPWDVVQLLYWKAPSAGMSLIYGFYNKGNDEKRHRSMIWAQHVVKDVVWKEATRFIKPGEKDQAVAALEKLMAYDDWWIRLYVAEMLRRHPFLREKRILERLRKDPNPLVAKAADVPFHFGR